MPNLNVKIAPCGPLTINCLSTDLFLQPIKWAASPAISAHKREEMSTRRRVGIFMSKKSLHAARKGKKGKKLRWIHVKRKYGPVMKKRGGAVMAKLHAGKAPVESCHELQ